MRATDIPGGGEHTKTSMAPTQQSIKSSFDEQKMEGHKCNNTSHSEGHGTHSTVEKEGFRKLIQTLEPKYEIPSRKYSSQACLPQLYTECRERVHIFLATTPGK